VPLLLLLLPPWAVSRFRFFDFNGAAAGAVDVESIGGLSVS
jgi:hypothetical protein